MKKATLVVDNFYTNNSIFDLSNREKNRDDCLYAFYCLREEFKRKGYDLSTQDINPIESSELVIYNEMPNKITDKMPSQKNKSFLLLFETELIKPNNWNLSLHDHFNKIFTWHDSIIDNKKYFKINFSHKIQIPHDISSFDGKKLVTLIAGNKSVNHPLELYSKRLAAINWFTKNQPQQFDFYGMGWGEFRFKNVFLNKVFKKLGLTKYFRVKPNPCYKGKVDIKNSVLKQYKFSICFENAKEIPGYITEKIFDCFLAGCVPVYWGAPNIAQHVPPNTYIDFTRFGNMDELYIFLNNMTSVEYEKYINSIRDFLSSERVTPFTAEHFAMNVVKHAIS